MSILVLTDTFPSLLRCDPIIQKTITSNWVIFDFQYAFEILTSKSLS